MAFAEAVQACPDGYYTLDKYADVLGLSKRSTAEWLTAKGANKIRARVDGKIVFVYGV